MVLGVGHVTALPLSSISSLQVSGWMTLRTSGCLIVESQLTCEFYGGDGNAVIVVLPLVEKMPFMLPILQNQCAF